MTHLDPFWPLCLPPDSLKPIWEPQDFLRAAEPLDFLRAAEPLDFPTAAEPLDFLRAAEPKCAGFYTLFKNLSFYDEFGYFAIEV